MDSELTKLRRKRSRIHRVLDRLEPLLAGYRAKLADTEARIHELAPELALQSRHRRPNPIFARGELTRLALDVLREAGEPLPVAVIAVRALARKGIALPDPTLRRRTRHRLRQMFAVLGKRGVTVRVGSGKGSRRGIAQDS
jgi:hypothetical protein